MGVGSGNRTDLCRISYTLEDEEKGQHTILIGTGTAVYLLVEEFGPTMAPAKREQQRQRCRVRLWRGRRTSFLRVEPGDLRLDGYRLADWLKENEVQVE